MTTKQYHTALKELNLPIGVGTGWEKTAAALGVSRRTLARLSAGDQDVPVPIALLLAMYLAHGLPEESA